MLKSAFAFALTLTATSGIAADVDRGRTLFLDHCATCHGAQAVGDGPLAQVLTIPPADLTKIAARNDGTFPVARIVRRIDGTSEVLAHGGPMPVFGLLLDGPSAAIADSDGIDVVAPETIVDIAAWLKSIQR